MFVLSAVTQGQHINIDWVTLANTAQAVYVFVHGVAKPLTRSAMRGCELLRNSNLIYCSEDTYKFGGVGALFILQN